MKPELAVERCGKPRAMGDHQESTAGARNEIARRVTQAISEVAQLPKEAVWVVFEDVKPADWFVGEVAIAERRG